MLLHDEQLKLRVAEIRDKMISAALRAGRRPEEIRLMAVTKTVPPERINDAIACGIDLLGENRVQEYLSKRNSYHLDGINIHFIGHLQSNKVKYIIDKVNAIESVDSLKLAAEIDRCAGKIGRKVDILLEVNLAGEETKSGFLPEQLKAAAEQIALMEHLNFRGLMCIPPAGVSARYFPRMQELYELLKSQYGLDTLSMGMSADFESAIAYGATIVRLGTALFGQRAI